MTSRVRFTRYTLAPLAFCLSVSAAPAATVTIDAIGRGLTLFNVIPNNEGGNYNLPGNNYAAGAAGGMRFRDHFDFIIPAGQWTSATLNLDEPAGGHVGSVTTFSVYALGVFPTGLPNTYPFTILGEGTFYGSVTLSTANDGTTVHIALNDAALADILAARGSTAPPFNIAGVDSGESSNSADFGNSSGLHSTLTLTSDSTPEPGSIALMGLGLAALLGVRFRKTDCR